MSLPDSLFTSSSVHAREVTLGDGSKHVLHFKELPATKFAAYHEARASTDEEVRQGSIARLIAFSVVEADGSPALDYERALQIKPGPANEMMAHILEVNGYGDSAKKG